MTVRVCHISTLHSASDGRIFYKECVILAKNDYDVYFIVSNKTQEINRGVNIIPLPTKEGRVFRFFVKQLLAFRECIKVNADIYHFHDPELIFMGLCLKILGKRVIYDVHEDVPAQILNKDWLGNISIRRVVSVIFNKFEKFFAQRFDSVVTVTDDIAAKFKECIRVLVLRNLPNIELIDSVMPALINKKKFIIIYAGGLTQIRGIEELIKAVGILNGKAELWLLGDWDNDSFESRCSNLVGFSNTKYFGYMKMEQVYSFMKIADLGLCTLYPTKNHVMSLPVKAFEYMACGLPMLMSDFPFWKDNFKDMALFVNPKSSEDIAAKVLELINNPIYCKTQGEKNKLLAESEYSWEVEGKKLIRLYEDILK